MTTPLDKLAETVGRMTPGPWWNTHVYAGEEVLRHGEPADCVDMNDPANAEGIAALRNAAEELIAVTRAARSVSSEDAVRDLLCCYTQGTTLLDALVALEAKLKSAT